MKTCVIKSGVYALKEPHIIIEEVHPIWGGLASVKYGWVKVFSVEDDKGNGDLYACWVKSPRETGIRVEEPEIKMMDLFHLIDWNV